MKKLNTYIFAFFLLSFILASILLAFSFQQWLLIPSSCIYTKEAQGTWTPDKPFSPKASGFHVKINSQCATQIYTDIEKNFLNKANKTKQKSSNPKIDFDRNEYNALDYQRFLKNKNINVDFQSVGLSYATRFKWFENGYITYDDPTLRSSVRFSFSNKCLYDKECLLSDSINYLFIKIGIKYFLNTAQADYLKNNCIQHQKIFYKVNYNYNFGHSDLHYKNGIFVWLKIWYNFIGVMILILSACAMLLLRLRSNKSAK